jgi:glycosyltransferase involved in cell wall biosynthesis
MAAGTPVIAFNGGGAPEYVTDGKTGVLFDKQSPEELEKAVRRFESMRFDDQVVRAEARKFDASVFVHRIREFVDAEWSKFESPRR